jgi:GT2 family glycosyltransferase
MPHVAIVVLNWNGVKDTLACLSMIYASNYKDLSVIVIDNNSKNNELVLIKKNYPKVVGLQSKINMGFTGGCNLGIKYAIQNKADYVWLLNNDAIVDPQCLSSLIAVVDEDPQIGLASSVIYSNPSQSELLYCGTLIDFEKQTRQNAQTLVEITDWQLTKPGAICLWGTALLIRSSLIQKIGFLDDRLFAYYEDLDYSVRSLNAGFKNVIVTSAKVFHDKKAERLLDYPPYYHFYMTRNQFFFWQKNLVHAQGYTKKYLRESIRKATHYHSNGSKEAGLSVVDGVWCALRGKGGSWDDRDKVPFWLQNSFMRYPRLWGKLAELLL